MDRCLTPFSPDLETTGQTAHRNTHTHKQTHTSIITASFLVALLVQRSHRAKDIAVKKLGGTKSFTSLYIGPASFPLVPVATGPHTQTPDPELLTLPPHINTLSNAQTSCHTFKHTALESKRGQVVTSAECAWGLLAFGVCMLCVCACPSTVAGSSLSQPLLSRPMK